MINTQFKWQNNWEKFEELYSKLTDVVQAKQNYNFLYKFDEDYKKLTDYTTVGNNAAGYNQMFAKTANALIEEYIRDEES